MEQDNEQLIVVTEQF